MKPSHIEFFEPEKIVKQLIDFAKFSILDKGYFRLVLAGGNTPKQIYGLLEQKQIDSSKWEIFVGDERDVPLNHADRNSTMIEQAMPQLIEKSHYFPIINAEDYDDLIAQKMPFDLVLLGIGEDGHTAGIFPNKTYTYLKYLQITDNAPKPPPRRISLKIEALNPSREIWVFASGESKKIILNQWFNGEALPIAEIQPLEKLILFCDKTALLN